MKLTLSAPFKGDCECCDNVAVNVRKTSDNIIMCDDCVSKVEAVRTVEQIKSIDSTVELKADIYNAATVSFIEMQASVQNDATIPAEHKQYQLAKLCAERIEIFSRAIFDEEKALMEKKQQRNALVIEMQREVAKLRPELRGQFKNYDVNYQPATPKVTKPRTNPASTKAISGPFTKAQMAEMNAASKKYDVPVNLIRMVMLSNPNMNAEAAARKYLELALAK